MPKIRGNIIRILDKRTVIINLGRRDGITDGKVFSILSQPEPVVEPSTGEELGRVLVVKAKVSASEVYEKFTIATTRWTVTRGSAGFNIARYLGVHMEVVDQGELRVDPKQLQPWKGQSEIPVGLGDVVEVAVSESVEPESGSTQDTPGSDEPDTAN